MGEEVGRLSADYKAQLPGIRDRAWELGWKAALRKAGTAEDSPLFLNPPKFSCSDSELAAVSQVSSNPPSQTSPEASAAPGVPRKAPAASADPESSQVIAVVEAPREAVAPEVSVSEAGATVPEATPTAPEASAVVAEVPPEIDCNVEAATL
eukprot:TRINITY_DN10871_c0_g1_i12.p1 TRINITY_DN10871_c0_g1~~TRINITY_DN10871_c0_g1_i12.p1  ORF type:complete len:162 (+),score=25.31 TRINITY_DN10871_c0_g1_i12:33-488(+)